MRETSFLVVPFDADAEGELRPGSPARLDTWEAAHFAATQVVSYHSGIAVIEEPEGAFAEPQILEILGSVSPATVKIFGARSKLQNCGRLAERMRHFMNWATAGTEDDEPAQNFAGAINEKRLALRKLPRACQRQPT